MSVSSWVIMTMLTPASMRMSNIERNLDFITMSSPVIGSSRTRRSGLVTIALAIRVRRISPRERLAISRSMRSSTPMVMAASWAALIISSVRVWFLKTSRLLKNPEHTTSDTRVSEWNWDCRSMETTPMRLRTSKRFQRSMPNMRMVAGFSSS